MQSNQFLENFSTHLKNVIAKAISLAAGFKHEHVYSAHLLLSLTEEKGSIGYETLKKESGLREAIIAYLSSLPTIEQTTDTHTLIATLPELNRPAKQALEKAMLAAYEFAHAHVGTEHLLYGILKSDTAEINDILKITNSKTEDLIKDLENIFQSSSKFPDFEEITEIMSNIEEIQPEIGENEAPKKPLPNLPKKKNTKFGKNPSALDIFTIRLTDPKNQKNIDPVIGREVEIDRLINILMRRNKNNPILVGEPGVGKTAIVEGLAKRIAEGKVPALLRRKQIFSLDLPLLISGTIYRGEFESRLKHLIDEISANPDYILFVDEIHNIIGAGSNQGTMDAANILKPALARGKLRCIGATTLDEYKKYFSTDPALERRFQSINVEEPSETEALQILTGLKKYYDEYHNVTITDDALESAVELSKRYIHDNFLPDKAIDLIDEAAASVRTHQKIDAEQEKILDTQDKIEKLIKEKEKLISNEELEKALKVKGEIEKTEKQLQKLQKKYSKKKIMAAVVGKNHIIDILSSKLQIKKVILLQNDLERISKLESELKKNIIGQDDVIKILTRTIKRSYLLPKNELKPLASLLFVGPSGVGKTALASVLAQKLYLDEKSLIRLDMSEFSESHGVSKLLGSPAGYVGFKERNRFLENLKQHPYSVVLLDEIDKAHPDVIKLLLQILDEGKLTESSGKIISFRHTIIILTTNIGSEAYHSSGIGFGSDKTAENNKIKEKVMTELKNEFGAATIGRLGAVCLFEPLKKENIEQIIKEKIDILNRELKNNQGVEIDIAESALEKITKDTNYKDLGARQIDTVLEQIVHDILLDELLKNKRKKKYTLKHEKEYILA